MLSKREKSILNKVKGTSDNRKSISVEIEDSFYNYLNQEAKSRGISVEDYFLIYIAEKALLKEKEELQKEFPDKKVVDIFEVSEVEPNESMIVANFFKRNLSC